MSHKPPRIRPQEPNQHRDPPDPPPEKSQPLCEDDERWRSLEDMGIEVIQAELDALDFLEDRS